MAIPNCGKCGKSTPEYNCDGCNKCELLYCNSCFYIHDCIRPLDYHDHEDRNFCIERCYCHCGKCCEMNHSEKRHLIKDIERKEEQEKLKQEELRMEQEREKPIGKCAISGEICSLANSQTCYDCKLLIHEDYWEDHQCCRTRYLYPLATSMLDTYQSRKKFSSTCSKREGCKCLECIFAAIRKITGE